jgi:hypothetical protein
MRPRWHRGWRQRTSLLALGALEEHAADEARAHVGGCAGCSEEMARLRQALELSALDPVRTAEPPRDVPALLARVNARLDAVATAKHRPGWRAAWLLPAGALAAGLAALLLLRPADTPPTTPATPTDVAGTQLVVSEDMLGRMERTVTRAQTARYLDEAQDLLLTVAAPRRCARQSRRVDVEQETERSRELLARRALLVGTSGEDVASARPVLRDVEYVLREVASLPSCARERDLQAIQREVSRRNLLMKIDLMTRELKG